MILLSFLIAHVSDMKKHENIRFLLGKTKYSEHLENFWQFQSHFAYTIA